MSGHHIGSLSRTVYRAAGIFGGTQMAGMAGSLIRTKLVAIWLGQAGVGLFGLFTTIIELIGALSQLGLRTSAVRDISELRESGTPAGLGRLIRVVRRWGWILGLLGAMLTVALSPVFAKATFGDASAVWPFMLLSVCVFLNSVTETEKTIMQGLMQFSPLARATLWGVFAGCLVSVPILYFWRLDSVAPVILVYSAVTFVAVILVRPRQVGSKGLLSIRDTYREGRAFVTLGIFMTVASVGEWLAGYLFMSYLNWRGGAAEMGLYQAGYTLAIRYSGILSAAVSVEYFPRIAGAVTRGKMRITTFMRHEMQILILMITAAGALLIGGASLVVWLLYNADFEASVPMLVLAEPGVVLNVAAWCATYVILAHGDGRLYMLCELASLAMMLLLCIGGYELDGLAGIGAALTLNYLLYMLIVAVAVRRRYGITFGRKVSLLMLVCFAALSLVSAVTLMWGWPAGLVIGVSVAGGACWSLMRGR